jgi:hypothetical protein
MGGEVLQIGDGGLQQTANREELAVHSHLIGGGLQQTANRIEGVPLHSLVVGGGLQQTANRLIGCIANSRQRIVRLGWVLVVCNRPRSAQPRIFCRIALLHL